MIQETYRPDKVDMYFDEALWRLLVEFARGTAPGARVGIVVSDRAKEMDDDSLAANASIEDPPAYLLVRANGMLLLCIETEYWTQVGGPWPYTYATFDGGTLTVPDLGSHCHGLTTAWISLVSPYRLQGAPGETPRIPDLKPYACTSRSVVSPSLPPFCNPFHKCGEARPI